MNRIITIILLSGLIGVGVFAGYTVLKVEEKPKAYQFVTRSAVDSTQFEKYVQRQEAEHPINKPFPWAEMTTLIVSVTVAGAGLKFGAFKKEIYGKFTAIGVILQSVADQKNRDNVDSRLVKIEQDAAGFVDDDKIRALLEGVGSRTRSFCRDVMQMDFTDECLEKAILKMNARAQDSKHQIKDLGFSNYFEAQINGVRCEHLKQLKIDLTRLVEDKLHNSKYERFGDVICKFQRNYMKSVIILHHETKSER
jgi:hypothetical protein